jgi:hypothetical protein
MSYNLLVAAIILYILSVVAGFVLMMVGRRLPMGWIRLLMLGHFLLLASFLTSQLLMDKPKPFFNPHLLFLITVCSGVMLAGYALRMAINIFLRVYFSLFMLTLPVFAYSPSTLISAITFHRKAELAGKSYPTGMKDYFLEPHNSMLATMRGQWEYKVVKKKFRFSRTLVRNIQLDCPPEHIDQFTIAGDTLITFLLYCPPGAAEPRKIVIHLPVKHGKHSVSQ